MCPKPQRLNQILEIHKKLEASFERKTSILVTQSVSCFASFSVQFSNSLLEKPIYFYTNKNIKTQKLWLRIQKTVEKFIYISVYLTCIKQKSGMHPKGQKHVKLFSLI